jgi:hypothetical protein
VLDQAEWRIDGGEWQSLEEILRLDNLVRKCVGLRERTGEVAQPWTDHEVAPVLANVELKFSIQTEVHVSGAFLAVERSLAPGVTLNGCLVEWKEGAEYWVDKSIMKISLPDLAPGRNELSVSVAFSRRSELEWMYLLGDFGVKLAGRHARLVEPPRSLAFGDWTTQGLPFYAGNVTYHAEFDSERGGISVVTDKFSGALTTVGLDGARVGHIAFPPFELDLGDVPSGSHRLDITVFGNRANAFGPLHCSNTHLEWLGPNSYRTQGREWAYEYMIRPMGLLVAPSIETAVA